MDPPVFKEFALSSETNLLHEAASGSVAAVAPAGDPMQFQTIEAKAEHGFYCLQPEALPVEIPVKAKVEGLVKIKGIGEKKAEKIIAEAKKLA